MVNSRRKGAEFERTLAKILREYGYDCRRGQQYCGANGDADVVGLPHIHIEAKAVEKLNIYNAMRQAKKDARAGEIPAVFHKKNRKKVLVTMELEGFMELYRGYKERIDGIGRSESNLLLGASEGEGTDQEGCEGS